MTIFRRRFGGPGPHFGARGDPTLAIFRPEGSLLQHRAASKSPRGARLRFTRPRGEKSGHIQACKCGEYIVNNGSDSTSALFGKSPEKTISPSAQMNFFPVLMRLLFPKQRIVTDLFRSMLLVSSRRFLQFCSLRSWFQLPGYTQPQVQSVL